MTDFGRKRRLIAAILSLAVPIAVFSMADAAARKRKPRYGAAKKKAPELMKPGRWVEANRKALQRTILAYGKDSPGYSVETPPAAAFVWDDAAVVNHVGEAAFYKLVTKAQFKFSDDFWTLIPPPFDKRAKTGYEGFKDAAPAVWPKDPFYLMYRKAMFSAYHDMISRQGAAGGRGWLTKLLKGFTEDDIQIYMAAVIDEELKGTLAPVDILEFADDVEPIAARRGLRKIPEMKELFEALIKNGWDVWILSSSNYWAAQSFSNHYGVDPSRVIGVRARVQNGVLQPELLELIPEGPGKAEALSFFVANGPLISVASGVEEDRLFLEYGTGLKLMIDRGNPKMNERARKLGWLIQPAFKPGPPES